MLTKHSCNIASSNKIALHAISDLTTKDTKRKFLQKQCLLLRDLKAFKLNKITTTTNFNTANVTNNYNNTTNLYCPRSIQGIKNYNSIRNYHQQQRQYKYFHYHHHRYHRHTRNQQVYSVVVGKYYNSVKNDKVGCLNRDGERRKLKN